MSTSPIVALIGRPNVGKSSLFNALTNENREAITGDQAGITRDRHYGRMKLENGTISLVDTGGLHGQLLQEDGGGKNHYFNLTSPQAHTAIEEATLILLVVDIREGRLPLDEEIARYLRSHNKEFWLLLNKCDSSKQEKLSGEFYPLGFHPDHIFPVSAAHRLGLSHLKQQIEKKLLIRTSPPSPLETKSKIVILGGPNVGKSTLLNRLLKAPRAVVSPFPGTTIDPLEEIIDVAGRPVGIIDTAGIRKKRLIADPIEAASVEQSFASMGEADIVLYMIDILKGPGHQDRRLIDLALDRGKSVIVLLNKIDLMTKKMQEYPREMLPCKDFCDLLPLSASEGTGLRQLFQCLKKTIRIRQKTISTGLFNRTLQEILIQNPPQKLKIRYALQVKSAPPTFLLYANSFGTAMPENYRRYLKRELRRRLGFDNTPIHLILRQKNHISPKHS